eukprot:GHVN01060389.1.p1 GENE.GHVN01060389.1~~GHVN01060389.1.p1  ORF type:complete len:746 (+),score=55.79 GHVN01060389.1:34-2238(+)
MLSALVYVTFLTYSIHTTNALGVECGSTQLKGRCGARLTCPPTFELVSKKCVKTSFYDSHLFCKRGLLNEHNHCEELYAGSIKCPKGYRVTGGKECSKKIVEPAVISCPDGATFREGPFGKHSCIKTVVMSEPCPTGTVTRNGDCVRTTNKQRSCPDGYRLDGGSCLMRQIHHKVPSCRESGVLMEGWCVSFVQREPHCHEPSFRRGQSCVESVETSLTCPTGFILQGLKCIHFQHYQKDPTCPQDYTLHPDGAHCFRLVQQEPICPPHFHRSPHHHRHCVRLAQVQRRCRPPYFDSDEGCRMVTTFEKVPRCNSDEQLNGLYCVQSFEHSEAACPPGSETIDEKRCALARDADVVFNCPGGFDRIGNECVRDETLNCAETHYETHCYEVLVEVEPHAHVGHTAHHHTFPHTYRRRLENTSHQHCIEVPVTIQQGCSDEQTFPLTATCPQGFLLNEDGDSCVTKDVFKMPSKVIEKKSARLADMVCPNGVEGDPLCSEFTLVDYELLCPPNYTQTPDHQCLQKIKEISLEPLEEKIDVVMECAGGDGPHCEEVTTTDAAVVCPVGFLIVENDQGGAQCERIVPLVQPPPNKVKSPPLLICPPQGCIEESITHPDLNCPPGFDHHPDSHNHHCSKVMSHIMEYEQEVPLDVTVSCPDGFEVASKKSKCFRYDKILPSWGCSGDATLQQSNEGEMMCMTSSLPAPACKGSDEMTKDGTDLCIAVVVEAAYVAKYPL